MTVSSPIKDVQTINIIKDLYKKKNMIRDLLLFEMAINTGANLNDLLNLNVKDVINKHYLVINGKKSFPINDEMSELIAKVATNRPHCEPLFKTSKNNRLDRTSVFYSFREICSELGLGSDITVASWRKTFAYHHYEKYKDLSYLQWLFNQTTVDLTMKFIGINENMNLRYRQGVCL